MDGIVGASSSPSGRRGQATSAQLIENVENERVVLRSEVENPQDVDDSKDKPASRHGVQCAIGGIYSFLDALDGIDNGYSAEDRNLKAMHGDRVAREGVQYAKDEEELQEYAEPLSANNVMVARDCATTIRLKEWNRGVLTHIWRLICTVL